jgi:hypothetical protein
MDNNEENIHLEMGQISDTIREKAKMYGWEWLDVR